jgi:enoyl-CoA hydratase
MNAAPSQATVQQTDGILTVTFDRDAKLNAISPEMTELLWSSVRRLADDDAIRVLVITAVGRYFTAGIDLASPQPGTVARTGQEFRRLYRRHHLLYDEMEATEKPIILAAQGPCLGAGLEMACSCDFRFASPLTQFALPEVKLGVIAGSGGTSRLTRLIGPHWAKWLAMAGRNVDAERALAIGLVHDVFAAETFSTDVAAFAAELAALPAEALGAAKLVVDMTAAADRETARQIERFANTHLCLTGTFRAATDDFNRS